MNELLLHGRKIETVFDLMGHHEDDLTRALGWTLSNCPEFLRLFVKRVLPVKHVASDAALMLQAWERAKGRTDIELRSLNRFHVIVEAKRGWQHPESSQLRKYAARLRKSPCEFRGLVILTDWSYSGIALSRREVDGIPVSWLPWSAVVEIAAGAVSRRNFRERHWIEQLVTYLREVVTMQDVYSNRVYVVSLGSGVPKGWGISWVDIVESKHRYFHPAEGGGWPRTAPTYLGWRYKGKLQGLAHILDYVVVPDMHDKIPEIPRGRIRNHVLYRIGQPFRPNNDLPTGQIYKNGRRWCMLDTLFTAKTIGDAARESTKREQDAKRK